MRIVLRGATEKRSRSVAAPHGKVVEEIELRAFRAAVDLLIAMDI